MATARRGASRRRGAAQGAGAVVKGIPYVVACVQVYIYTHVVEGRGTTFLMKEIYICPVGMGDTDQLADQLADFINFQTTKSQKFCQNPQTGPLFCM
jgi:hypothetical protein